MTDASISDLSVLIVEDNPDMQFLLKSMVREFGVQSIEVAHDGTSGLAAMQLNPVDLVLCDVRMQPMGGLEFVTSVRGGHPGIEKSVPIILLTAHSDIGQVAEAGIIGVDGFVTKPVSADTLFKRIRAVVAESQSSLAASRRRAVARIGESDEVDDAAAQRARDVVANLTGAYIESATRDIEALEDAHAHAIADPAEHIAQIKRIGQLAHDIEGQGGSFGYPLMSAIGGSLGECCRAMERSDDSQLELIKAHVDAMKTVIGGRLDGDAGTLGTELMGLLHEAVGKDQV